jgi:putative membrane-bound dehydrogenase-like protein
MTGELSSVSRSLAQEISRTGPATEKRFPPLKLPSGFKATLFACDPLVEYPSAVALGPRPGSVFVAVDYMTGLGTEIIRRDEIRLLEDGYADKATVYADGFNSIEGLTFHNGAVYVMHAPFLTVLRDADGDGKADERRDLLSGLGLRPEENPVRLHCANGLVMGHDGWLYLALGDHGCNVKRPEGDRLILEGGGILRCRPDGRDLHLFATGLRNIYDVALDSELNVFVRDNENDGGEYKIRVCHSFFGADHGYPYLYYERRQEAMPPLADLGLGSSAGGLCYLEQQFPAEYQGNLFFCEWGRAVVRYRPERKGGGFAPLKEIDFASGAANDPYGFKPTDLVVERDGSLIVVDWADGQRPRRGRGRVYRIGYVGTGAKASAPMPVTPEKGNIEGGIARLDSPSYYERIQAQAEIERLGREGIVAITNVLAKNKLGVNGRLHAVWILARHGGEDALEKLFALAKTDHDSRVRAQAVRAIADLTDPILVRHHLDAGLGDSEIAGRLARLTEGGDPNVLLEVVVALGRLGWAHSPAWLEKNYVQISPALTHAAQRTLRRSKNWPALLKLLDEPERKPIRALALRAIADQFVPGLVDGVIERLGAEKDARRRYELADSVSRVYKKPGPWVYWGYSPPPRPANTVSWERSQAIEQALDRMLNDKDQSLRLAVLRRMQREKIPTRSATMGRWLREERNADHVAVILNSIREQPPTETSEYLAPIVTSKEHTVANRLEALALLAGGLDKANEGKLRDLAESIEDGPVMAGLLSLISKRSIRGAIPLLLDKASSLSAEVRAAAIEALAKLEAPEAGKPVQKLLKDENAGVRRAAAAAAGRLKLRAASDTLLRLAQDTDAEVRRASLESLRRLGERRALPLALAALTDQQTELTALACVDDLGGPEQAELVIELGKRSLSAEILILAIRVLTKWENQKDLPAYRQAELDRAVAELQGIHGTLVRWNLIGPVVSSSTSQIIKRFGTPASDSKEVNEAHLPQETVFAQGSESPIKFAPVKDADRSWFAYTDVVVSETTAVEFSASSRGGIQVLLNGQTIHQRDQHAALEVGSERFAATLVKGRNRLVVIVSPVSTKGNAEFQLSFRRKSSSAQHEKLTQAALTRTGDVQRGRQLFFDAEKGKCIKCHRLGDQGERIGPELTGLGRRFSRIHIIESILEPSRTIAPGFDTSTITLKSGRVLTGIIITQTEKLLTLADNQGQKHEIIKSEIEERQTQPISTMPEGLGKQLSTDEFIDLITFLVSQKETRGR